MILHDQIMSLSQTITVTNSSVEFIIGSFNKLYMESHFIDHLRCKQLILHIFRNNSKDMPTNCPTIIIVVLMH
jgi:hypothetical protein